MCYRGRHTLSLFCCLFEEISKSFSLIFDQSSFTRPHFPGTSQRCRTISLKLLAMSQLLSVMYPLLNIQNTRRLSRNLWCPNTAIIVAARPLFPPLFPAESRNYTSLTLTKLKLLLTKKCLTLAVVGIVLLVETTFPSALIFTCTSGRGRALTRAVLPQDRGGGRMRGGRSV